MAPFLQSLDFFTHSLHEAFGVVWCGVMRCCVVVWCGGVSLLKGVHFSKSKNAHLLNWNFSYLLTCHDRISASALKNRNISEISPEQNCWTLWPFIKKVFKSIKLSEIFSTLGQLISAIKAVPNLQSKSCICSNKMKIFALLLLAGK